MIHKTELPRSHESISSRFFWHDSTLWFADVTMMVGLYMRAHTRIHTYKHTHMYVCIFIYFGGPPLLVNLLDQAAHISWLALCFFAQFWTTMQGIFFFQFYALLETTLNTVVLLPSFVNFFEQTKKHSLSPGNLAVTFLAFGMFFLPQVISISIKHFIHSHGFLFLTDFVPWCSFELSFCTESSLFRYYAHIPSLEQHHFSGGNKSYKSSILLGFTSLFQLS